MSFYLHRDPVTRQIRQLNHAQVRAGKRARSIAAVRDLQAWQPIGPTFARELRLAGCAEGVSWDGADVEHPFLSGAAVYRTSGLVTIGDDWAAKLNPVRAVLAAHDPTLQDALPTDAEDIQQRCDGLLALPAIGARDRRALLLAMRSYLFRAEGARTGDPDLAALDVELAKTSHTETSVRALASTTRARAARRVP